MRNQVKTKEQQFIDLQEISFENIFKLADVQYLQDLFADAHGVASLITDPEGNPLTQPSNFTRLCENIIRKTEKGCANCFQSDSILGRQNPAGPVVQTCLSGGLWDAGASITVGGKHIANWLMGQVRNELVDEQQMMLYAEEIGADMEEFKAALNEVPVMAAEKFQKIAKLLFAFAKELSEKAFSNLLLNRQIDEKERANALLLEQEELYLSLLKNLEAGIVVHAADTSIVMNNSRAAELLGLTDEQLRGKAAIDPAWKFVKEDNTPLPLDEYPVIRIIRSGNVIKNQILGSFHPSKNKVIWATVNGFPVLNSKGEITQVVISFIDITKRKIEEMARIESDELFKHVFKSSNVGKSITSPSGAIKVNKAFCNLLGYNEEELHHKKWQEITHPDDLDLSLQEINKIKNKEVDQVRFNKRFIHKNGSVVWVDLNSSALINKEGELQLITTMIDITERKHLEKIREVQYNIATAVVTSDSLEQLLEFVRSELSQLFDTTNFFAALYNDRNHTLKKLHWVDEADDFTEWDVEKSFSGYVFKTGKALLMNKQEIAQLSTEQDIPIVGTPAECWLGVPLIVNKKPIGVLAIQSYTDKKAYDTSGAMLFGQVANDLSVFIEKTRILQDLNIAKNHAEESDRLKSAFLANMSHEIRTPMNGILGFAEILKDPNLTGEQQREYINIIGKSGIRMLNIINDIIDISKIESGLMNVNVTESNVNEQIEYIYTFFKPEVEAKGMRLSFKTSLPAKQATIHTDREKLYAILTNLVKNAIKFSKEGTIEFGYDVVEKIHEFSLLKYYVKDSGIGIPKDRQTAIFERFIQADINDKMARQGAGLGLSISKAYVEMLGGKIWVESEEGKGSTFYFTLPYHVEQKEETVSGNNWLSDLALYPEEKLKILIAEDDETSEMLLEIAVKGFSREILKVRSGNQAVDVCRKNPDIDLVFIDILMPEMNGYEAVRKIRQFNRSVVIIAQTAYGLSGDKEKSIDAGCNDHIAKPIAKAELQAMIRKYFRKELNQTTKK